jgi:hypothetical protein
MPCNLTLEGMQPAPASEAFHEVDTVLALQCGSCIINDVMLIRLALLHNWMGLHLCSTKFPKHLLLCVEWVFR